MLIIDEWDEADRFGAFFSSQPEIADHMADSGVEGAPEVSIYRVIDTPDRF